MSVGGDQARNDIMSDSITLVASDYAQMQWVMKLMHRATQEMLVERLARIKKIAGPLNGFDPEVTCHRISEDGIEKEK